MSADDWLDDPRGARARAQIVDAAALLFAERGVAAVGMAEVARAAGCSRATLYRWFDSRDALRLAFVDREAHRIATEVAAAVASIADPAERLVSAVLAALAAVRGDDTLMSWFTADNAGTTVGVAQASEVIGRLAAAFLGDPGDPGDPDLQDRSDWLVRSIVSLLVVPGASERAERAMLERFVAPAVLAGAPAGASPARRRVRSRR